MHSRNRRRAGGCRIERWLHELGDSERRAMPIDFVEATMTLPSNPHPHPQPHPPAVVAAATSYFDSGSGSSDTSAGDCSEFSATEESETEVNQSGSSSLSLASLNSNKLKIVRLEQKQQQQKQQSCPDGCGDNRMDTTGHICQSPPAQELKGSPSAGVTCRFHLRRRNSPSAASKSSSSSSSSCSSSSSAGSACQDGRRQRRRRLLTLLRTLKPEDPALMRISAHRGVSISLGAIVGRRRPVAVNGASWRAVIEAVSDLSRALPGLMSPADASSSFSSSSEAAAAAEAAVASATETEAGENRQLQPSVHAKGNERASTITPPEQTKANEHRQHRNHQSHGEHRKHQHQLLKQQSEQPVISSSTRLAQNVRFQLITPQRESLFMQDSATGRPAHPRLRRLLTSLGMEMLYLERSVGPNNVPSVKVRFLLDRFEQLTAFCNAIDYQLPNHSSV